MMDTQDVRVRLARERLADQYGYTPQKHHPQSRSYAPVLPPTSQQQQQPHPHIPQQPLVDTATQGMQIAANGAAAAAAMPIGLSESDLRGAVGLLLADKDAELAHARQRLAVEEEGVLRLRAQLEESERAREQHGERCRELEAKLGELNAAAQQAGHFHKLLLQSEAERDTALMHAKDMEALVHTQADPQLQQELSAVRAQVHSLQAELSQLRGTAMSPMPPAHPDLGTTLAAMQSRLAALELDHSARLPAPTGVAVSGAGGVLSPDPHPPAPYNVKGRLTNLELQLGL